MILGSYPIPQVREPYSVVQLLAERLDLPRLLQLEAREKIKNDRVFLVRIEQLYPFPVKTLAQTLKRFRKKRI